MFAPIKPEPADIILNRFYILILFFGGIRIIKTEMTPAIKIFCQSKIEAETFCMSNMEIAVWFRRETGDNLIPSATFKIFGDDGTDKI